MKAKRLNQLVGQSREKAQRYEPQLVSTYARAFRAAGRRAASEFEHRAVVHLTAAGETEQPKWTQPDMDEMLDVDLLKEDTAKKTAAARKAILKASLGSIGADVGIRFDLKNPLVAGLLTSTFTRVGEAVDLAARLSIRAAVEQAWQEGLSIPHTAALINERLGAAAQGYAKTWARTDMLGLVNGGSMIGARLVGASTKSWITAGDDKVRPTHQDAEGQTVPLDQPFQVGDDALDYPGDPQGSDAEIYGCRCSQVYEVDEEAGGFTAAGTSGLEAALPLGEDMTKKTDNQESLLAAASGDTGLKLGARDETWDAGAAEKAMGEADLPRMHFWKDPNGDPKTKAAYKLPFATPDGGAHAVWGGVTAAAQRLSSTQIPSADVAGVKSKIAAFYAQAAKLYNDDTIKVPWENDTAESLRERIVKLKAVSLGAGFSEQFKAGFDGVTIPARLSNFTITAAAVGQPTKWQATLLVEGEPTEDMRMIAPGATTWRELPLTLCAMLDSAHADVVTQAPLCGRIDTIERQGNDIVATGIFDEGEYGIEIARLVADKTLNGISVDMAVLAYEIQVNGEVISSDSALPDAVEGEDEVLMVITEGVIGSATVCPFQAIANATIQVTASADESVWTFSRKFEAQTDAASLQTRVSSLETELAAVRSQLTAEKNTTAILLRAVDSSNEVIKALIPGSDK